MTPAEQKSGADGFSSTPRLPHSLTETIIDMVALDTDVSDASLATFSLISKSLLPAVRRSLYSQIYLYWKLDDHGSLVSYSPIAETLKITPHLAKVVKKLSLDFNFGGTFDFNDDLGDAVTAEVTSILKGCSELTHLHLFSAVKNSGGDWDDDGGAACSVADVLAEMKSVTKLQELEMQYAGAQCLDLLVRTTSLRHLTLRSDTGRDEAFGGEIPTPEFSFSLTSLDLRPEYTDLFLALTLHSFETLRSLYLFSPLIVECPERLRRFVNLQELSVELAVFDDPNEHWGTIKQAVLGYTSLHTLKLVQTGRYGEPLPLSFLSAFPTSIVHLDLSRIASADQAATGLFRLLKVGTHTRLRTVRFAEDALDEKHEDRVDEACEKAGVELIIVAIPAEDGGSDDEDGEDDEEDELGEY